MKKVFLMICLSVVAFVVTACTAGASDAGIEQLKSEIERLEQLLVMYKGMEVDNAAIDELCIPEDFALPQTNFQMDPYSLCAVCGVPFYVADIYQNNSDIDHSATWHFLEIVSAGGVNHDIAEFMILSEFSSVPRFETILEWPPTYIASDLPANSRITIKSRLTMASYEDLESRFSDLMVLNGFEQVFGVNVDLIPPWVGLPDTSSLGVVYYKPGLSFVDSGIFVSLSRGETDSVSQTWFYIRLAREWHNALR